MERMLSNCSPTKQSALFARSTSDTSPREQLENWSLLACSPSDTAGNMRNLPASLESTGLQTPIGLVGSCSLPQLCPMQCAGGGGGGGGRIKRIPSQLPNPLLNTDLMWIA